MTSLMLGRGILYSQRSILIHLLKFHTKLSLWTCLLKPVVYCYDEEVNIYGFQEILVNFISEYSHSCMPTSICFLAVMLRG